MGEVGGGFEGAESRNAGRPGGVLRRQPGAKPAPAKPSCGPRARAHAPHMPGRELRPARKILQERFPIFVAFSASYHHSVGRPERAYFGNGSAWLKRSQRA